MTTQNRQNKSFVIRGIATALNSCGNAVVVTYDSGAKVVGSLFDLVKKIPGLPAKIGSISGGLGTTNSPDIEKIYHKIKEFEKKIKAAYYEIGKARAQMEAETTEADLQRDSNVVQNMVARVKEYETSIADLKQRVVELEEAKKAQASRAKEQERYRRATLMADRARKGKENAVRHQKVNDVNMAIKEALIHGDFESASDRAIFDKVATDLLDKETEIRMLAAAELGKMGNKAAVPVLHAAIMQDDSPLVTEITNSLISLGDPKSVPILFDCTKSPNERVRVGALRGLYKLAPGDQEIRPAFLEGLKDAHPEVRKTAATMLGWLDEAASVPALVQCLTDEDLRVKKAVIAALANIRDKACMVPLIRLLRDDELEIRQRVLDAIRVISGERVEFDVTVIDETRDASIENLKRWWQDVRSGKEPGEPTAVQEEVASPRQPAVAVEEVAAVEETDRETAMAAPAESTESAEEDNTDDDRHADKGESL